MRSIKGGKSVSEEDIVTEKRSDAFQEAEIPSTDAASLESGAAPSLEDPVEPIPADQFASDEPEPVPIVASPKKRESATRPQSIKSGGGKILGGTAIVMSLSALAVSGYFGFQQKANEVDVRESMMGMSESIFDLNFRNDEITAGLSDTNLAVQNNDARIATFSELQSDIQSISSALNGVQEELIDIRAGLENQQKVLSEHRSDIDLVSKDVKTLNERPPVRQVVREVRTTAPRTQLQSTTTLEGATLASIDMWGTQPYVVLRDNAGGWVPLQAGDTYRGWFLESASGSEAVFKAGTKTRRMSVE